MRTTNNGAVLINLAGVVFQKNTTVTNRFLHLHRLVAQRLLHRVKLDGKHLVIHATQVAAFFAGKVFLVHCGKFFRQLVYLVAELLVFFF